MNDTSVNSGKRMIGYLVAFSGVTLITLIFTPFREHVNVTTVALLLLLVVLLVATIFGSRPALSASLLGVFCFNFFFLPPVYTLTVADPQNWVALFAFLAVAITVGQLSAKVKKRAEEAERLYRELQDAFEKASQAEAYRQGEKLKSALLDAVTHDLRTPLTSIKASVTMLMEDSDDAIHITLEHESRRELLAVINEEADLLNNFIESMVEVAQLEAGKLNLRKTETAVNEIIDHCLQRARKVTVSHLVRFNPSKKLLPLFVDKKAISEAIYNLVENAVKYSPPGSTIEIGAKIVGDDLRISVEDEGGGIAEADRDKVFQKFYRGDKTIKGFGMGLAIVRGIIEAHSGKIWIENGKKGAKFVLQLPIKNNE